MTSKYLTSFCHQSFCPAPADFATTLPHAWNTALFRRKTVALPRTTADEMHPFTSRRIECAYASC